MEGREEEAGLVADTNILVSALIKDHSINAKLIKSGYFTVYFPEYGLKEIDRYQDYITAKRKKSSEHLSLEYAREFIFKSVHVVPLDLYREKIRKCIRDHEGYRREGFTPSCPCHAIWLSCLVQ